MKIELTGREALHLLEELHSPAFHCLSGCDAIRKRLLEDIYQRCEDPKRDEKGRFSKAA